jgi:hypothetical protein
LPAGGRVVIDMKRVIEGPGALTGIDLLPGFTEVEITRIAPNGKIVVNINGQNALTLANTSGEPVRFIEVRWSVKQ